MFGRIVSAFKRKGGVATLTEIKRSFNEFNQSGGMEKLRQYITALIANGTLVLQTAKGGFLCLDKSFFRDQ
jgi:hypothetical protein